MFGVRHKHSLRLRLSDGMVKIYVGAPSTGNRRPLLPLPDRTPAASDYTVCECCGRTTVDQREVEPHVFDSLAHAWVRHRSTYANANAAVITIYAYVLNDIAWEYVF